MSTNLNPEEENLSSAEKEAERALRPILFDDFSGQESVVDNLRIFVQAAKQRQEALDHVLLHGPPGLGKTTLAHIISQDLGVNIRITSGPVLDKPGDLSKEEVEKIWNHVIYYNFVQEFLSTSRKEPLPKSWENGAEPFKSVIKKYAPRKVLLLGKRLTKHLLYIGLIEGSEEKYKVTCLDGIVAVSIYHPSCGGFSPTRWSGVLRENGFIENYFE